MDSWRRSDGERLFETLVSRPLPELPGKRSTRRGLRGWWATDAREHVSSTRVYRQRSLSVIRLQRGPRTPRPQRSEGRQSEARTAERTEPRVSQAPRAAAARSWQHRFTPPRDATRDVPPLDRMGRVALCASPVTTGCASGALFHSVSPCRTTTSSQAAAAGGTAAVCADATCGGGVSCKRRQDCQGSGTTRGFDLRARLLRLEVGRTRIADRVPGAPL